MAIVELAFSALPVHVRTARLIVTAVARRSGVAEGMLDEVRLAVGEACSRAVEAHRRHCPAEPVRLELNGGAQRFEVVVTDAAPGDGPDGVAPSGPASDSDLPFGDESADLGLAVIAGLADEVQIDPTPQGVQIRMSWPVESDEPGA